MCMYSANYGWPNVYMFSAHMLKTDLPSFSRNENQQIYTLIDCMSISSVYRATTYILTETHF